MEGPTVGTMEGGVVALGATWLHSATWAEMQKADSTLRSSQAVPHPSTSRALCRLTSEVERDPVHSTRYGRQRDPENPKIVHEQNHNQPGRKQAITKQLFEVFGGQENSTRIAKTQAKTGCFSRCLKFPNRMIFRKWPNTGHSKAISL